MTRRQLDAQLARLGFILDRPNPNSYYIIHKETKRCVVNPKTHLPVFRSLKDVQAMIGDLDGRQCVSKAEEAR